MSGGRLPLPERLLADRFLDGDAAEFVVGDLVERYEADRRAGMSTPRARARLFAQTLASCRAWRRHGMVGRLGGADPERNRGDGMIGLWTDVRIAMRGLSRRPAFGLGVALTLGLGVGATTSIFSVVDAVVLRPLAFEDPDRLVAVGATFPTREWADEEAGLQHLAGINLLNLLDYADRARSLSTVAGVESRTLLFPDLGNGPELVPPCSGCRSGRTGSRRCSS